MLDTTGVEEPRRITRCPTYTDASGSGSPLGGREMRLGINKAN